MIEPKELNLFSKYMKENAARRFVDLGSQEAPILPNKKNHSHLRLVPPPSERITPQTHEEKERGIKERLGSPAVKATANRARDLARKHAEFSREQSYSTRIRREDAKLAEETLDNLHRLLNPDERSAKEKQRHEGIAEDLANEREEMTDEDRNRSTNEKLQEMQRAEMDARLKRAEEMYSEQHTIDADLRDLEEKPEYDIDLSELNETAADRAMQKARTLERTKQILPHAEQIWDMVNERINDQRGLNIISAMDYVSNLALYRESLMSEYQPTDVINSRLKSEAFERLHRYNKIFGISSNDPLIQSVLAPEEQTKLRLKELQDFTEAFSDLQQINIKKSTEADKKAILETWAESLSKIHEATEFSDEIKQQLIETIEARLIEQNVGKKSKLEAEIKVLAAQFLKEFDTVSESREKIQNRLNGIELVKGMTVAKAQNLLQHPDLVWEAANNRLKSLGSEDVNVKSEHHPATQFVFAIAAYNDAVRRLDNKNVTRYRQIVDGFARSLGFDRQGQALINSEMLTYDEDLQAPTNPFR